jgi:hypothetical protein
MYDNAKLTSDKHIVIIRCELSPVISMGVLTYRDLLAINYTSTNLTIQSNLEIYLGLSNSQNRFMVNNLHSY